MNLDGKYTYTPAAGWTGTDSIGFHSNDGHADSNDATMYFAVSNDIPETFDDIAYYVPGQDLHVSANRGLLYNAYDDDDDSLTITVTATPLHGTLNVASDGSFVYTPASSSYAGTDQFSFKVSDGITYSNESIITLHHADDSLTLADDSYWINHGQTFSSLFQGGQASVLDNDADAMQLAMTVVGHTNPQHGQLLLQVDGTFTYTPDTAFVGTDSFTYTVSNGIGSKLATVQLIVDNQAPLAAAIYLDGVPGQPMTLTPLDDAADDDGDALSIQSVTQGQHGTVTLNSDGTLTYVPDAAYVGLDSFTYTITDGIASTSATVWINLLDLDTDPDYYEVGAGNALIVDAANGVFSNDDLMGQNPTIVIDAAPTKGQLTMHSDGSFTYIADAGAEGQDTITYTISEYGKSCTSTLVVDIKESSFVSSPTQVAPPTVVDLPQTIDGLTLQQLAQLGDARQFRDIWQRYVAARIQSLPAPATAASLNQLTREIEVIRDEIDRLRRVLASPNAPQLRQLTVLERMINNPDRAASIDIYFPQNPSYATSMARYLRSIASASGMERGTDGYLRFTDADRIQTILASETPILAQVALAGGLHEYRAGVIAAINLQTATRLAEEAAREQQAREVAREQAMVLASLQVHQQVVFIGNDGQAPALLGMIQTRDIARFVFDLRMQAQPVTQPGWMRAIGFVGNSIQVVAGGMLLLSSNPLGIAAGSWLVVRGIDGVGAALGNRERSSTVWLRNIGGERTAFWGELGLSAVDFTLSLNFTRLMGAASSGTMTVSNLTVGSRLASTSNGLANLRLTVTETVSISAAQAAQLGIAGNVAGQIVFMAVTNGNSSGNPASYLGNNPVPASGNRVNTDLPGGQTAARQLFDQLTGGNHVTHPQSGHLVGPNGHRLRLGGDGRWRVDVPAHNGLLHETIHFNN